MLKNSGIAFLFFLFPLCCIAQTNNRLPLRALLEDISKQHTIKFSQIDEEIEAYKLIPPNRNLSLKKKLEYIEQRTSLRFEAINPGMYAVYSDLKTVKPLCGYIRDLKTGKGVGDATITIPENRIAVSSDSTGYFSLKCTGACTVLIAHLGYSPKSLTEAELQATTDCPTVYLEEAATELKEVIAERYLAAGISKDATGKLTLKPRKFGILPGLTDPDILQTMQQLPGIMSIDETVSNINVRGGTHDQNLFLWNGIRMFQTSHFFGLISAFNPLQATTISIYKNGTPAMYGESVSSLANISTHTDANAPRDNAVAIDMINANFLATLQLSEKDIVQVTGRRTYSDIWATPTFEAYQHRVFQNTTITDVLQNQQVPVTSTENFYFYDLSLSCLHTFNDKHKLFVDGIAMKNNLDIFQHTDSARKNGNLAQQNYGGSASFLSKWNERNETEVQAYLSYHDLDATNESIENEQTTHQTNTILDKGIRMKYNHVFSPTVGLNTGYELNEISIRNLDEVTLPSFYKNEKVVSVSHAVSGQANYTSPNGRSKVSLGVRGTYFNKYNTFLPEPRLAVSRVLLPGLSIELLAEKKSQTLSQIIDLQQDFLGIEKRRWVLANNNTIPIQKSTQASVGFNYAKNGWFASVEGFYKKVTGITSDGQGFQNQFEFSNSTGQYRVIGSEFLIQKKINHFYAWASYSYNDNQYHFDSFLPPGFTNNFAVTHAVTTAGIYEQNGLRIALGTKWRTGTPLTEPSSYNIDANNPANSQIIYRPPNSSKLDYILQVNFSASKTWNLGRQAKFTASCSVLNLLNRQNVINKFYRINKENNHVESINTYGLGRTPNISMKIIF